MHFLKKTYFLFCFPCQPKTQYEWKRRKLTQKHPIIAHKFFVMMVPRQLVSQDTSPIIYAPLVVNTSQSFPHSWPITGFVTKLTRLVPLVEQELLTLPEHLSSPPVFSGVRVTRSLVLYLCFIDRCLSFCTFSFGHCVVCSSSIYGFWLYLWYLQTLHIYLYLLYSHTTFDYYFVLVLKNSQSEQSIQA